MQIPLGRCDALLSGLVLVRGVVVMAVACGGLCHVVIARAVHRVARVCSCARAC